MQKSTVVELAKIAIALSILILLFVPFHRPSIVMEHRGFDENLIAVDPRGGVVTSSPDSLNITATADSQPTVHVVGSLLSFSSEFDVAVTGEEEEAVAGNYPVQIKLWYPLNMNMVAIWFSSEGENGVPDNRMFAGVTIGRAPDGTEVWGEKLYIGRYSVGPSYRFRIEYMKRSYIRMEISNSTWNYLYEVSADRAYPIFSEDRLALTFFATSVNGSSTSIYRNLVVTLPDQDLYGAFISDQMLPLYLFLSIAIAVVYAKDIHTLVREDSYRKKILHKINSMNARDLKIPALMVAVFLLSLSLFSLGTHPFDMYSEKIWSYITVKYGLRYLYPLSFTTTAASAFGDPYQEAAFPYPPFIGYYFYAAGLIHRVFSPSFDLGTSLEYTIKAISVAFSLLAGLVVYKISKKIMYDQANAFSSMLLWVLNPVVLFGAAIWGESDTFLIFFLLLATASLIFDKPNLAWTFMAFSILTKQTALIPVLFMAIFALKKYRIRKTILGISMGVAVAFIIVLPFLLQGYSPTLMVDPIIKKSLEAGTAEWSEKAMSVVSRDAFNIWPLATYFIGESGMNRFWYSDLTPTPYLEVNFMTLGLILFGICTGTIILAIVFSKTITTEDGNLFIILSVTTLASIMLPTRVAGRYFVFVIPFLILSRKHLQPRLYYLMIGIISVTTFVSMFATIFKQYAKPYLSNTNPFLSPDIIITMSILSNLFVLVFLSKKLFNLLRGAQSEDLLG